MIFLNTFSLYKIHLGSINRYIKIQVVAKLVISNNLLLEFKFWGNLNDKKELKNLKNGIKKQFIMIVRYLWFIHKLMIFINAKNNYRLLILIDNFSWIQDGLCLNKVRSLKCFDVKSFKTIVINWQYLITQNTCNII